MVTVSGDARSPNPQRCPSGDKSATDSAEIRLLLRDADLGPHPRVDAALVFLDAGLVRLLAGRGARLDVSTRRPQRGALGSHFRQARELVEHVDDSAAVLVDLGEGVVLTSVIRRDEQV